MTTRSQRFVAGCLRAVAFTGTLAFASISSVLADTETETKEVEARQASTPASFSVLEEFAVIGSKDAVYELPGSAYFFDTEQLRMFNYTDVTKLLREVPGVYIRPEDGWGLFPNISIRGVDGNRSGKVTIMEDGILAAPAAYSAPSAYYTPTLGRMSGLEVLKGSSQIKYGPQTTGGVINYLSTPVPDVQTAYGRFSYGSYNNYETHVYVGTKEDVGYGQLGFLLEYYNQQTDGFKTLDSTATSDNSGSNTGFRRNDYNFKLSFEPNWDKPNYFEFRIGYLDLDANETYLGIATSDFNSNPHRRYAASRFDNIQTFRTGTHLRHFVELSPDSKLTTTVYYSKFNRNWYKINDYNAGGGNTNPAQGLFPGTPGYALLTGTGPGTFRLRANNREYTNYGFQTQYDHDFTTGEVEHQLQVGFRAHYDSERRFQSQDTYTQNALGEITSVVRGVGGSQANQIASSVGLSVFAQDRMEYQDWAIIPGVRYEYIFQDSTNYNAGTDLASDYGSVAPGVGVEYTVSDRLMAFGGYYRGFSIPGPADAARGVDPETSDGFELGIRYQDEDGFRAELVGFYTLFDNLLALESIGGGVGQTSNVGKAYSRGIEALVGVDPARMAKLSFNTPITLAFTYTDARLSNDATDTDPESPYAGGRSGNRLPYIPPVMVNLTAGVEYDRVRGYVSVNWVSSQWASAANLDAEVVPVGPTAGTPDARFGKIDSYTTVDLSIYYRVWRNVELFAYAQNVFDESYIASRLPQGPRPGAPRMLGVGVQAQF